MAKHGFTLIGAGINGAVFKHPNHTYVVKVYRQDREYDEWLQFARTHRNNPHVPRVKSTHRINSIFNAVRIEPLVPCPVDRANDLIDQIQSPTTYADVLALKKTNPALGEIAAFMRDWEPVSDLTAHNMMMRPNGEIVLVDPLYLEPGQVVDW